MKWNKKIVKPLEEDLKELGVADKELSESWAQIPIGANLFEDLKSVLVERLKTTKLRGMQDRETPEDFADWAETTSVSGGLAQIKKGLLSFERNLPKLIDKYFKDWYGG